MKKKKKVLLSGEIIPERFDEFFISYVKMKDQHHGDLFRLNSEFENRKQEEMNREEKERTMGRHLMFKSKFLNNFKSFMAFNCHSSSTLTDAFLQMYVYVSVLLNSLCGFFSPSFLLRRKRMWGGGGGGKTSVLRV